MREQQSKAAPLGLYSMRYRTGSLGVQTAFIQASSQEKAEQVGQAWCNLEPFRKYISVGQAVIADESILAPEIDLPEETKQPDSVKHAAPAGPPPVNRKVS